MTTFPTGLGRVPDLYLSQLRVAQINRSNVALFEVEQQLASGREIGRFSDDAARAAAISTLDQTIERSGQWLRNLETARSALDQLDGALGDAQDAVLEAKSIASEFVNSTFSADDRAAAAITVDSLLDKAFEIANRSSSVGHMFGGNAPGSQPVQSRLGGFAYTGRGDGLRVDLGPGVDVPLTLGPDSPLGGTSARVSGFVELRPPVADDTPVADLRGARGTGVQLAPFDLRIDGGGPITVDISQADTAGDIAAAIESAIRQEEQRSDRVILGPQGVRFEARSLRIDLAAGDGDGPAPQVAFEDTPPNTAAADLGLLMEGGVMTADADTGADLNPRLSWLSPLNMGDDQPLGEIRIRQGGQARVVDLSQAQTLQDLRKAVEDTALGVRVELDPEAGTIDLVSDLAVARGEGLSVEEVEGNFQTAQRLGIRSFAGATPVGALNDGRGVRIVHDQANPATGLPEPARNTDFRVTLGNGVSFDVDLRPQDLTTVAAIAGRINDAARDAGVAVPNDFEAGVVAFGSGGLALRQDTEIGGTLAVEALNASPAIEDLGLTDRAFDAQSGVLAGRDVAQARVRNVFSDLLDLRQALRNDDTTGITFAGESIEKRLAAVAQTRAIVGGNARRVQDATELREDIVVLDQATRSQLADTDFAKAATNLTQLQLQLQAAFQATATSSQLTLLNFLG